MFCTNCGSEIKQGAAFCAACGAPVRPVGGLVQDGVPAHGTVPAADAASAPAASAGVAGGPAASSASASVNSATAPSSSAAEAAPSAPASAMPGSSATETVPSVSAIPPQPPRKKHRGLMVLLIVAALVALAVLAILLMPGGSTGGSGFDGATPASIVTRIRPQDEHGTFLTSYRVRLYALSEAYDKLNDELVREVTAEEPTREARVTGDGGFTFGDIDDVPDGNYLVVIVDNDTEHEQNIVIQYEEDNSQAEEEIIVVPPAEEDAAESEEPEEQADPRSASYALYLEKCREIIETYGEPGAMDIWSGSARAATGLVLAQTIDFNADGVEELLVAYTTNDLVASFQVTEETYRIEVWAYDPDGGEDGAGSIALIHEQRASYTNGGATFLSQYTRENKVYLFFDGYESTGDTFAPGTPMRYGEVLWGMRDDGSFAEMLSMWGEYTEGVAGEGSGTTTFTVDGAEATYDAFVAAAETYTNASTYNLIEFTGSEGGVNAMDFTQSNEQGQSEAVFSVDQTLQITQDTLTLLEAGAQADAS